MAKVNLTSPLTGATVAGLTSPTYTFATDAFPGANPGMQWAVTALGGTQTSVRLHTVGNPFTISFWRGANLLPAPTPNPTTGLIPATKAMNKHGMIARVGVIPLAGQAAQNMYIRVTAEVPPGADTADPQQIRAAISATFGALSQQASAFADQIISGLAPGT